MEKPISRQLHGLITDYPYVALVGSAPETVGFKDEEAAVALCRTLAGGILVSSLLTRAEWGLVSGISFKTHLFLDVANGIFAGCAPYLFGFSENKRARNFFLVAGAFGIFWMRQFALGAVPQDLVDAGRVDGCNFWQLYVNALPLLRPALAFLGIFTFITTWNDYFWPLIVLVNPSVMTLQVALSQLNGVYNTDYAAVMAGTLISTIPLIVIFILGARHFIGNIAAGALKA